MLASTVPSSSVPASTDLASTEPESTVDAGTEPTSTEPASTEPSSTFPASYTLLGHKFCDCEVLSDYSSTEELTFLPNSVKLINSNRTNCNGNDV